MASNNPTRPLGNVLVVGGCGFLGHHIVSQLLESYDAHISVLDLHTARNRHEGVDYYDADITSPSAVQQVFDQARPNVIVHTAALPPTVDNKALLQKVNVNGTQHLIDCAAEMKGVKAFVYTSSASVVHDTVSDLVNADERWPCIRGKLQKEYYGETKVHSKPIQPTPSPIPDFDTRPDYIYLTIPPLSLHQADAEALVLAANRGPNSMLTVSLRPAGIIGEGDALAIPNMLKAYANRQTKFQLGDNDNLFDFTYVGNVAHAHILAVLALLSTHTLPTTPLDHERVDGEAFFITNDSPVYFWDFPRMVWKVAGDGTEPKDVWVIQKDWGLAIASVLEWVFWMLGRTPNLTRKHVRYSCMTRYYNIDKAKRRLGYKPIVSLEEGVRRAVRWFEGEEEGRRGKKEQ
ncbi:erg26, C-3 sterol dehydrogenase [Acarospora aff. strigata]|nr:erg26, C-3 sterol dehydrogenase [Acarospora aff. strigata]